MDQEGLVGMYYSSGGSFEDFFLNVRMRGFPEDQDTGNQEDVGYDGLLYTGGSMAAVMTLSERRSTTFFVTATTNSFSAGAAGTTFSAT